MNKKQLLFFATKDDIIQVFKILENTKSFHFVLLNNIPNGVPYIYSSITELENLSISMFGDTNQEKAYLIIQKNISPIIRKVEQYNGEIKYIIDQYSHPDSILFKAGGIFGDFECIISGQISTISNTEWSQKMYASLSKEIKKQFKKSKPYYIGESISNKLKNNIRLTSDVRTPIEYDFKY